MTEIILHHYTASPFSERVRLTLGLKKLAWRKVEQRHIMPKPQLIPLTGGYRKIPVMQIGAHVYCDSLCIVRELERRWPTPSVFGAEGPATHMAFSFWADRVLFPAVSAIVFGQIGGKMPEEFLEDRVKLLGRSFDVAKMKAAIPLHRDGLRAQLEWLEVQLRDERRFLLGAEPGLADFSAYQPLWFLKSFYRPAERELAHSPRVVAWMGRVAAIGHGESTPLTPEEALAIARTSQPDKTPVADSGDPSGRAPGDRVSVMPDDYGRDPVSGVLLAHDAQQIALLREDPEVGEVVVHFPRAGFWVTPQAAES